jgi:hypothetical protein
VRATVLFTVVLALNVGDCGWLNRHGGGGGIQRYIDGLSAACAQANSLVFQPPKGLPTGPYHPSFDKEKG